MQTTQTLANVTRWAALLDEAARQEGLEPAAVVPLALAIISKESAGLPSARNQGSNTIGLGQQLAYVDRKPYRANSAPFTHPRGENGGFRVSWSPVDQTRALIGLLAHYLKSPSRTGGHLPSAWLGYASGPGAASMFVQGDPKTPPYVTKHVEVYAPSLSERYPAYSAWYHGWAKAGRPTTVATVASGEGTSFKVTLAAAATPAEPLQSPFDGTFKWNGKTRKAGPVGPSGVSPSQVPGGTPGGGGTGNTSILLLLGTVIGGLLGFGLLRARGGA